LKNIFLVNILVLLSFTSCHREEDNNFIKNNIKLTEVIDNYINRNSIESYLPIGMNKDGFSTPSLQIYFNLKNKDTIMSIIRVPFLNDYEIDPHYDLKSEDTYYYYVLEPDGSFLFKNKYPLIFFNTKYYKKENLKKYLTPVPDSLKFNKINAHLKQMRWNFKINNNNFIRINN